MLAIDSVGWAKPKLDGLVRRLDDEARLRLTGDARRMHGARGLLTVAQPGVKTTYLTPVTQIGSARMTFLLKAMLHPGTLCILHLRMPDGERFDISGKTSQCRHVDGLVHEVELVFDSPIDLEALSGGGEAETQTATAEVA